VTTQKLDKSSKKSGQFLTNNFVMKTTESGEISNGCIFALSWAIVLIFGAK
tara:strand:+ start:401 stop:553 length:153 start_codon:yes stop_codon:yes gene_type:complete